jgi:hypothetical protein
MNLPYPELNSVLEQLTLGARSTLGDALIGVYLHGSFAMGDGDEHSDVDFLAVVREPLNAEQCAAVQTMHQQIYDGSSPWAQHLEGSYIDRKSLRKHRPGQPLYYLDNGSRDFIWSDHDNTLVVRWQLLAGGVALDGPPPSTLLLPVEVAALKAEVRATLRDWGHELLAESAQLHNRWRQAFAVVMYCRMLHTLATGRIHSKRASAEWAMQTLAAQWRDLIAAALADRPYPSLKFKQQAAAGAVKRTQDFVAYALTLILE